MPKIIVNRFLCGSNKFEDFDGLPSELEITYRIDFGKEGYLKSFNGLPNNLSLSIMNMEGMPYSQLVELMPSFPSGWSCGTIYIHGMWFRDLTRTERHRWIKLFENFKYEDLK